MSKPQKVNPLVQGLAGSLGGVAEACMFQPIDVIKTRIQLDAAGKYKGMVSTGKVRSPRGDDASNIWQSAAVWS